MNGFANTDAWILCSIAMAAMDGPPVLRHIVSAADHLNVAIPTLEELNGAVRRLSGARVLLRDGRTLAVAEDVRAFLNQHHHKPACSIVPLFESFLREKAISETTDEEDFFTAADLDLACLEYRRKVHEILRRPRKGK